VEPTVFGARRPKIESRGFVGIAERPQAGVMSTPNAIKTGPATSPSISKTFRNANSLSSNGLPAVF
jgi:hypothetical protein